MLKGQIMKRRLGLVMMVSVALVLGGCPKDEPASQANNPTPAAQEVASTPPTGEVAQTAAVIPTKLGDPAYPLTGLTWVKGGPVMLTPGKVYVVEFWATWCPPCRESIPHLTSLQKKYDDRVTFVGISSEDPGVVKTFVGKQGDNMDYNVAVDAMGKVGKGYMDAFRQGGIPTAFVVDSTGQVIWYGHPLGDLEKVLDRVLAGTYQVTG